MESAFKDAAALYAAKKYHEAVRAYVRVASNKDASSADRVRALNNISACYASLEDYGKALEVAQQVLQIDEQNAKALGRVAAAHEGMKQYEEAIPFLQRALRLEPDSQHYKAALARVQGLVKSGHGVASEEARNAFYYDKSLRKGTEAMNRAEYLEAVRHYTKAIDLLPAGHNAREEAALLANRSAAHFRLSHFEESAADAEASTRVDATYARGFFRLACAQHKLCRVTQASEALDRCLALEPAHKEAAQLRDGLRTAVEEAKKTTAEKAADRQRQLEAAQEEQREAMAQATAAAASSLGSARHAHAHSYAYCNYCNETGHTRSECPLLRRKRFRPE